MNNDLNDLVKRGAVCDMLHDEMGAWGSCADEIEALLKANDALFEIPAVDAVEVVHGKWEMDGKNHCHCTNCKDGRNIETQIGWNFCPNCGADMRERKDNYDPT